MKILIISDTHRSNDNFNRVMDAEGPIDMLIHCGDIEGSEYFYSENAHCPVYMVAGNNDYFSPLGRELEFEVEGYRIFLTHGHNYYVAMGNERIKQEARERGADIVIYGHIHRPVVDVEDDVIALNPGSLAYPRQEGHEPTYMIMTIDDHGDVDFEVKKVWTKNDR